MPAPSEVLHLWLLAAAEPLGLCITTPDPIALKWVLYNARTQAKARGLAEGVMDIQIRTSPRDPKGELWLVRGDNIEPPSIATLSLDELEA